MAGGILFPDEDLPESYFQGGTHLYREPDAYPDLHQLFNFVRGAGGARKGKGTVLAGQTAIAVTFSSAFPAASAVKVVATAQGQNVNVWVSAISVSGCTLNIAATLGVDCDVAYTAFV